MKSTYSERDLFMNSHQTTCLLTYIKYLWRGKVIELNIKNTFGVDALGWPCHQLDVELSK